MAKLSRVITARLTPEEFEDVRQRAVTLGITSSALLREALVAPSLMTKPKEAVLLREVRAMRAIVINLLFQIGTKATLTDDYVRQIIHKADRDT